MKPKRKVSFDMRVNDRCPYSSENCQCLLRSGVTLSRGSICRSEDYDECPIYLSYLLAHTQAFRTDCDWLDAQS